MADIATHLPYALRQFESEIIVPLTIFGVDASFTNGSSAKLVTLLLLSVYMIAAMREGAMVPSRLQASAEFLYTTVAGTVTRIAGPEAKSSIPFIFSVTTFILFGTLLGLTPIKETFTAHLLVTLSLAMAVFVHVNVIAFQRHGLGFFRLFLPHGVPVFVAPVLVLVEVVSYLFRPLTLGFRIFANIFAGHVMLKLFGDMCAMLVTALGTTGIFASVLPVIVMVVLLGFEIMVVIVQSYIFLLISSMYLRDAIHLH
ncbi:MAG: F0F1 ATP synthase subunit A [Rhodospirillales bacterium]|nr:F0F1 ATP synthase subunit A [Rhodospirillales bacterium]